MRAIIPCLMAVSLFACNPSWAAGEDDRNEPSNEKSSPAAEKKSSETAKPGTPAAPNPAIESELKQLRQLVQEQAEKLHGLQQRLADVEGEVAAGKSASGRSGLRNIRSAARDTGGVRRLFRTACGAPNERRGSGKESIPSVF